MKGPNWEKIYSDQHNFMDAYWLKTSTARGNKPNAIYVIYSRGKRFSHVALQYLEPGKWEHWAIRRAHRDDEIHGTWSTIMEMIRPLIGDRAAVEVYPRECDIVNTAHFRHFWIPPEGLQPEFDLRTREAPDAG